MKNPDSLPMKALSGRIESLPKGVECLSGVLKGRFRSLKIDVQYQEEHTIKYLFWACCSLHNMLHAMWMD